MEGYKERLTMNRFEIIRYAENIARSLGFPNTILDVKVQGEVIDCFAFNETSSLRIKCETSTSGFRENKYRFYGGRGLPIGDYRLFLFDEDVDFIRAELPLNWLFAVVNKYGEIIKSSEFLNNLLSSDILLFDKDSELERKIKIGGGFNEFRDFCS